MPVYEKADREMIEALNSVMRLYHQPLVDAGVIVTMLVAYAERDEDGEPRGPALKHHGLPAMGLTSIVSLNFDWTPTTPRPSTPRRPSPRGKQRIS